MCTYYIYELYMKSGSGSISTMDDIETEAHPVIKGVVNKGLTVS